MIKKLFEVIKGGKTENSPATIHQKFKNVFSLDAPAILIRNDKYDLFQLYDPNDELATITIGAYAKDGGTLEEFCEYRFANVEDVYKPVSEIQVFEAEHAVGKIQEFEGTFPNESEPTYFVAVGMQTGDVFLSINFVTEREHYTDHRSQYTAVLESIRPDS
ncbi:hypothetical protein GCM10011613_33940 [Cellvibrio zantedeschiae]|uniref:T6SS immunity protein Tdi1 C-terminal domain-containing protein n=1 Tax=Cellvibrio zantedeschiae TaxID=1237077 RepID=A0ABQ3BAL9_9GAMM|nr:hypothetical protein [Cellvibrio zantedeschiae]GGY86107.1 hypothetical protein GCM10011613_33940 [Cellvibrio zantedeschiae]